MKIRHRIRTKFKQLIKSSLILFSFVFPFSRYPVKYSSGIEEISLPSFTVYWICMLSLNCVCVSFPRLGSLSRYTHTIYDYFDSISSMLKSNPYPCMSHSCVTRNQFYFMWRKFLFVTFQIFCKWISRLGHIFSKPGDN